MLRPGLSHAPVRGNLSERFGIGSPREPGRLKQKGMLCGIQRKNRGRGLLRLILRKNRAVRTGISRITGVSAFHEYGDKRSCTWQTTPTARTGVPVEPAAEWASARGCTCMPAFLITGERCPERRPGVGTVAKSELRPFKYQTIESMSG